MDARTERTRGRLQHALLELARTQPIDEVTIGDLADRAGVNRSTFYQHYADKDSLLADALDAAVDAAGAGLTPIEEPAVAPPDALVDYLVHIDQNAALYRLVLGDRGSAVVAARVRGRIEGIVRGGISAAGVPVYDNMPLDVVAAGIAGAALGVIRAWVEEDDRARPEVAAQWVWRVILGPGDAWN